MARDPELLKQRDERIRAQYEKMRAERVGRKPKYTVWQVFDKLRHDHSLSVRRLEAIVYPKAA